VNPEAYWKLFLLETGGANNIQIETVLGLVIKCLVELSMIISINSMFSPFGEHTPYPAQRRE
jgi:hypothetical protein